jgi:hypothetical protein
MASKGIFACGALIPGESNIGAPPRKGYGKPEGERVGPDVVWLTRHGDANKTGVITPAYGTLKSQIRLHVDVPDEEVHPWPSWATPRDQHEMV